MCGIFLSFSRGIGGSFEEFIGRGGLEAWINRFIHR